MKANELRIGNYFIDTVGSYCNPNTIQQVHKIDRYGVNGWQDMGASGVCEFEQMNPIPLTEEWLLKFGFEKYGNEFTKEDINIYHKELNEFRCRIDDYNHVVLLYVHALQNLFFALTGEELTIKE